MLLGHLGERDLLEIDFAHDLGVRARQGGQQVLDAATDGASQRGVQIGVVGELRGAGVPIAPLDVPPGLPPNSPDTCSRTPLG